MWNDILLIEKITMTQRVNILLYYLRMLPWIGKKVPQHWFASIKLKQVLAIIAFIGSMIANFFLKGLYIILIVMLPAQAMTSNHVGTLFCVVVIYLILSGFAGPLLYDEITRPAKKDYVMVQLMHMGAKRYIHAKCFVNVCIQAVMLLTVLLIAFGISGYPLWYPFIMVAISFCMRLAGNIYHFQYAQKKSKPVGITYYIIVFIITYSIAFGGAYLIRNDAYVLHAILVIAVFATAFIILMLNQYKQLQYDTTMRILIHKNRDVINGTLQKNTYKKDVEIRDGDVDQQDLQNGRYRDKKGYAFLNALFFQRHKRLFYKPMLRRMIGIVVVFIIIDVVMIFARDTIDPLKSPLVLLPPMVFVLYSISIGERVTRAMFYNCDVSLLHYGYYRQPDAILTNFKLRLRRIILLNSIIATLLCVGFASLFLVARGTFSILDIFLFMLTLYSIAIFFSVHHLCMYYLLQPYTGELEMKSPIFGVVSGVVYMVSYVAMRMDGSVLFTLIVLCATIIYSVVAVILVWKKAPSTFHIR